MRNFYDYLFVGINENLKGLYEVPGNLDKIMQQHRLIFNAIKQKDSQRAIKSMRRHIQFVLDFFKTYKIPTS